MSLLKSSTCSVQNNATEDLPDWLEDWEPQMDVDLAWLLNDVGWAELKGLASRFKSLNPEIFNSRRYSVKSSFKGNPLSSISTNNSPPARCVSSARGFIAGLHPEEYSDFSTDMDHVDATERSVTYLETEIEINNRLLRFFDSCRRHVDWEDSPRCENESRKFIAGGHVSSIRKEIARTLGLKYITNRQVVDLHQLVVFETALFGKSELKELFRTEGKFEIKFWRIFFEKDILNYEKDAFEVLEYVSDLKHYYKTGYGYALNYRSATPLLDDMVGIIREMVENPDAKPRADLYFGHAETAVPLMALLGLFEGAPLTADSFVLGRVEENLVRSSVYR